MSLSKRKANCVFGCSDLGAYMHRFPHPTRKAELFMSWMSTVGDRLKDIEPDKIFRNKRVCDYHFMPEHKFSSHRLYHYAVPSLHFTGIFPSLITAVQLEHNYCQPRMLLMETRPTENVDISQNEESLDGDEMSQPGQPVTKPPGKSWREINQERKALKRQRNEEKIVKREKRVAIEKEVEEKAKVEAEIEKKYSEISTISIAVPGSILENAQSAELRTYLAGQIARAACVFCVDEVIVYDDIGDKIDTKKSKLDEADGVKVARKSCVQLARILQYLECPQYLRKHFFPLHKDLEFAGLLNPLDAPHHLRQSNDFRFREGITMNKKVKPGKGSQVNVGLLQDVSTDKLLNPGIRVTVRMLPTPEGSKKIKGKIVSLTTPRAETGVYWGYTVRIANNLSQVFTQSPYKNGYDLTIGTSDRGTSIDEIQEKELKYNHALIVFGGLHGIETALESDEQLQVDEASLLFNQYLNVLPNQGSRTIRTEEAILVTLSGLRSKLKANNEPMVFKETTGIASSSIFANQKGDSNQTSAENLIDLSRFD